MHNYHVMEYQIYHLRVPAVAKGLSLFSQISKLPLGSKSEGSSCLGYYVMSTGK